MHLVTSRVGSCLGAVALPPPAQTLSGFLLLEGRCQPRTLSLRAGMSSLPRTSPSFKSDNSLKLKPSTAVELPPFGLLGLACGSSLTDSERETANPVVNPVVKSLRRPRRALPGPRSCPGPAAGTRPAFRRGHRETPAAPQLRAATWRRAAHVRVGGAAVPPPPPPFLRSTMDSALRRRAGRGGAGARGGAGPARAAVEAARGAGGGRWGRVRRARYGPGRAPPCPAVRRRGAGRAPFCGGSLGATVGGWEGGGARLFPAQGG